MRIPKLIYILQVLCYLLCISLGKYVNIKYAYIFFSVNRFLKNLVPKVVNKHNQLFYTCFHCHTGQKCYEVVHLK